MIFKVEMEQFVRFLKSTMNYGGKKELLREVLYYVEDADLHMLHKTQGGNMLKTVYHAEDIQAEAERSNLKPREVVMNFFNQYLVYAIQINP